MYDVSPSFMEMESTISGIIFMLVQRIILSLLLTNSLMISEMPSHSPSVSIQQNSSHN
jgi:hypothetical protein